MLSGDVSLFATVISRCSDKSMPRRRKSRYLAAIDKIISGSSVAIGCVRYLEADSPIAIIIAPM